ncbi:Cilia- and flagella-associated protein 54 [Saguinus oedipus]|uniref:Cilia- and flagella-associated protein 54 n=1 Tax=Saguinus oedipus TaxID=9490 RepID=A0ABQ9UZV9_SAGOE|nr:Cilia- and flagella-associated protein 54 [Saguinus oedipus]
MVIIRRGMLGCLETVARQPRVHIDIPGLPGGAPSNSQSDESTTSGLLPELPSTPLLTSTWTCPEDSLPAAVFYGPLDEKNPLLVSCEKEIRELLGFMRKKKAFATTEEEKHEFRRRW